ncbi:MAG: PAS domain S-box protein [Promethearchaeota archaeon]
MGEINPNQKIIEKISKSMMFADAPGFIVVALDLNKEIVYMNQNGCYILNDNISPIGKNWFDNFIYESEQKKLESEFESSISGKITKPIQECFVICNNSERRIIRWFHDIIKDGEKIIGIVYFGEDVTSKRFMQLELRHRVAMEQLIAGISTTFLGISQTPELFEEKILNTLANVGVFVNCDRCSVFLFDKKTSNLANFFQWDAKGVEPNRDKLQELSGRDFSWLADYLEEHNIIFTSKMTDLPENITPLKTLLSKKPIKSLLIMPMIIKDYFFGFLSLTSEFKEIEWSNQDIKLLHTIADLLSNVFCYNQIREDKRLVQKRLDFFNKAVETSGIGFIMSNFEGEIRYANQALKRLLGYDPSFVLEGKSWKEITSKNYFEILEKQVYPILLQEEIWMGEIPLLGKNGKKIETLINIFLVRNRNNKPIHMAGIITDISEQKNGQIELRKSQRRFMNLAEKFPLPFVISNNEKFLYFNPKFIEMFGYSMENIPNNDAWMQTVYPDPVYRAKVDEYWKKVKAGIVEPRGHNVVCKNSQIRKVLFREFEIGNGEFVAIVEEVND